MLDYEFSVLMKLYLFGRKLHALVKKHNSDIMSQVILLRLVSLKRQSVSEIAQIMSIKVSAATEKIHVLEHMGFLRQAESGGDKRSHMIDITEKGKQELMRIKQSMSHKSGGLTIGISEAEAEVLSHLLDRIRLEI